MKGVFEIDLNGVTPKVTLDGVAMTNVADVRVSQTHGEFPKVAVLFDAHSVNIQGRGDVALQSTTIGPSPEEFLDSIDIGQLFAEATEQASYGQSPVDLFLERLKERAYDNRSNARA